MGNKFGSVWNKWDFHVHTPYSILNNKYGFEPFELNEDEIEKHFDEYVKMNCTPKVRLLEVQFFHDQILRRI